MSEIKICDECEFELDDGDEGYGEKNECFCEECWNEIKCERQVEQYQMYDEGNIDFADPGGNSALRAATEDNPRNLPCPNCGRENMLTPADRQLGYQCDICADAAEGIGGYGS